MPIYMDVHIVPGVTAKDVAEAHRLDLIHQAEHGCKCMTYWIDELRQNVFCLVEAPEKDAVERMHTKAHGLVPNKIIEVNSSLVESFLGRIYDPADAETTDGGLKVFCDPSFRILLVTKTQDPALLANSIGSESAKTLLANQNGLIRAKLEEYGGREAEHGGDGFIASFSMASKALACALSILGELGKESAEATGLRIALNGGEPVEKSNRLFGDTIKLALDLCSAANGQQVAIATAVKDMLPKELLEQHRRQILHLGPQDERLLAMLFEELENHWQDPDFDVSGYCQSMAMSKSQLYRKTICLTGISPNILLKDFRLEKARDLMKKRRYSISQITFEAGFTSPSYFTKCFKKKYGLLPMAYLDLLH